MNTNKGFTIPFVATLKEIDAWIADDTITHAEAMTFLKARVKRNGASAKRAQQWINANKKPNAKIEARTTRARAKANATVEAPLVDADPFWIVMNPDQYTKAVVAQAAQFLAKLVANVDPEPTRTQRAKKARTTRNANLTAEDAELKAYKRATWALAEQYADEITGNDRGPGSGWRTACFAQNREIKAECVAWKNALVSA